LGLSGLFDSETIEIIFVTEVSDTLISGFKFIDDQKENIKLIKVSVDALNTKNLISNKWELKSLIKVEDDLNEFWDSSDSEKGLIESDLYDKKIQINLNKNETFVTTVDSDTLTYGSWSLDKSAQIVKLVNEYIEDDEFFYQNAYLTIMEVDSEKLKLFKKEDIRTEKGGFERIKFIEQYEKVVTNAKTP
jgi:hypothetical protein